MQPLNSNVGSGLDCTSPDGGRPPGAGDTMPSQGVSTTIVMLLAN
jgi:hypothetical protein